MGRPLRVWEPGAVYHVTPKGNDGRTIFLDDRDRRDMLVRMDAAAERYGATFHGYCLMDNHLHYLIESGEDGLSRLLQVVLGGYSRGWNRRNAGEGHAFRNHAYAVHVKTEAHYYNAVRYVDMNPVAAGIVPQPEEWPWSSFRGHAGLEPPPRFLDVPGFLSWFGPDPARARASYLGFVARWRPPRAALDPVTAARLLEADDSWLR
jgi:REP element-mobilizing transposase RayT